MVLPGIAAFLLIALWQVSAVMSDMRDDVESQLAVAEKHLRSSQRIAGKRGQLEASLKAAAGRRVDNEAQLIMGTTAPLAAANLQDSVKQVIIEKGGRISSERVAPTRSEPPFQVITVSFDFILPDVSQLGDILYSIESRTPYLVIPELSIQVRNIRNPGELTVKINVSALWRSPQA